MLSLQHKIRYLVLHIFSSSDRIFRKKLKKLLGFFPGNTAIYLKAFRHKSVCENQQLAYIHSNERLEFLGDSVMNTIVADYLYNTYPNENEGFLTEMRAKIVNGKQHLEFSNLLNLKEFIQSNVEEAGLPKVYSNTFEALIGAIYEDLGYKASFDFVITKVLNKHISLDQLKQKIINYKSRLIEWGQKEKKIIRFEVIEEANENNEKRFIVHVIINNEPLGEGTHTSKKEAEQIAAEAAYITLGYPLEKKHPT